MKNSFSPKSSKYFILSIIIGFFVGVSTGFLIGNYFDNIALGLAMGIGSGLSLGAAIGFALMETLKSRLLVVIIIGYFIVFMGLSMLFWNVYQFIFSSNKEGSIGLAGLLLCVFGAVIIKSARNQLGKMK